MNRYGCSLPTDATLNPQEPTPIVVQPLINGASGVYNATVTLEFSDGRVLRINVKAIVSSSGGATALNSGASKQSGLIVGRDARPHHLFGNWLSSSSKRAMPAGSRACGTVRSHEVRAFAEWIEIRHAPGEIRRRGHARPRMSNPRTGK
jgi:hypothetical protein